MGRGSNYENCGALAESRLMQIVGAQKGIGRGQPLATVNVLVAR
jgi:hypothetical protein